MGLEELNKEKTMRKIITAVVLSLMFISLIVFILIFISNLKSENNALKQRFETIEYSKAYVKNEEFLKTFFNYSNTYQRYENIEAITTQKGYHSVFPSGVVEKPKKELTVSVSSRLLNVKSFEHQENKEQSSFYNELIIKTTFNGTSNTQKILVSTKLIFAENNWKIDDFEFLLSREN